MKILIVDDSKAMRLIVMRQLRQAGYGDAKTFEAANGLEALAAVEEHQPDLVLSDWNMPEMNGYDFLKALRAKGDERPFGFITSEGTTEMRDLARDAGAAFLISKPFTTDDYLKAFALAKV
jgi:two-component system chemotaxis response regulator CheY